MFLEPALIVAYLTNPSGWYVGAHVSSGLALGTRLKLANASNGIATDSVVVGIYFASLLYWYIFSPIRREASMVS